MAPFNMLAIQACNLGQGIDENPVTVNKGVQFCFIRDDSSVAAAAVPSRLWLMG